MIYRPLRYEQMMKAAEKYDVRARRMFNGMGVYTGEKMFAFLIGEDVGLKLSPEDLESALTLQGAEILHNDQGKPMPEYVRMPRSVLDNQEQFMYWLERSADYAMRKLLN